MKATSCHLSRCVTIVLCCILLATQTSWATFAQGPQNATIQKQTPPQPALYSSPEAEAQARLASAHTLFLANDGADNTFPYRAGDGYLRFANNMQTWGRYRIVKNVGEADLVIQFRAATTTTVIDGTTDSPSASVSYTPYFKLTIADPADLRPIWPITIPVQTGRSKKPKADLFDLSVENAVSQVKLLAGVPLSLQDRAALEATSRARHLGKVGIIAGISVAGLIAAAAIATPILMHNAFNDEVAKQKQEQADFCKQNHIPNCPT